MRTQLSEEHKKRIGLANKGKLKGRVSPMRGRKHTQEAKNKVSAVNKGRVRSKETREKMSIAKKGIKKSESAKLKMSMWHKGRKKPHRQGSKSHFWKGGVTPVHLSIRQSLEYRIWREAVFKRDNYTCIWCGAKSGNGKAVVLNADHIKPFSLYPELRFAIDNGRTLCVECHRTTDTYGVVTNINLK